MEFEYNKLRGKVTEKYGTQGRFAQALGVQPMTVTRKLTGQCSFSREDMVKWANLLGISRRDIGTYFFEEKVGASN